MKRFVRPFVLALVVAALGFVVALVPQKNATGSTPLSVAVTNTPLPVSGSITVANTVNSPVPVNGSVGVTGAVEVTNPANQTAPFGPKPLVVDAEEAARNPYTASCGVTVTGGGDASCQINTQSLPNGTRLVIDTIAGYLDTPHGGIPDRFELQVRPSTGIINEYPVSFSVLSNTDAGQDVYQWMNRTQIYVDGGSTLIFDTFSPSSGELAKMTITGHFVTLPAAQ